MNDKIWVELQKYSSQCVLTIYAHEPPGDFNGVYRREV
jgi:hypothetical protein